jgi:hypothetical protein
VKRQATVDAMGAHERASATKATGNIGVPAALAGPPSWLPERLTLAAQQRWFLAVITTPESEAPPIDEVSARRLATAGERLSALERLEIYRRGYQLRLIECLADDYPALAATLSEADFAALCRSYVARYPSSAPSLNLFGQHMAEHCRHSSLPSAAFLADLAVLEWAVVLSIHAPTAPTLTPDDLSQIPFERWPEARLIPNPSLEILSFAYPVNAYFQAYMRGGPLKIPTARPTSLAVYRTSRSVWRLELSEPMVRLFSALAAGTPLGPALEQVEPLLAGRREDELAALVTGWFQQGVESGLFSDVALD